MIRTEPQHHAAKPKGLNIDFLRKRLSVLRIGSPLYYFETVDSTNTVGVRLAEQGAAEGTLILAESQTAGRGRFHRRWQSPLGTNLYFSFVLRPDIEASKTAAVTFVAGVAAFDALFVYCRDGLQIKWPNDILIHNRKVCGILTELKTAGNGIELVVGVGINVNIKRVDFDVEYRERATSLAEETGNELPREDVLIHFCTQFQRWYGVFLEVGFEPIKRAWLDRTTMVGRLVKIRFRDETQEGLVWGIDDDGALLLVDGEKTIRRITAGEATVINR